FAFCFARRSRGFDRLSLSLEVSRRGWESCDLGRLHLHHASSAAASATSFGADLLRFAKRELFGQRQRQLAVGLADGVESAVSSCGRFNDLSSRRHVQGQVHIKSKGGSG